MKKCPLKLKTVGMHSRDLLSKTTTLNMKYNKIVAARINIEFNMHTFSVGTNIICKSNLKNATSNNPSSKLNNVKITANNWPNLNTLTNYNDIDEYFEEYADLFY